jgi:glycosyltransferase involved in cell wall biosynthesis
VVHLHAVELDDYWRASGKLVKWAIGLPFRVANANIVLGDVWKSWLSRDLHVDSSKVAVLANGVPSRPYIARNHFAPKARVELLFLGNLLERKGVSVLLDALSRLPPGLPAWRLTLAGGGDLVNYARRIDTAGLNDRIEFLGWLDTKGAQRLLAKSDVLVLPSYHEGLPLVILEALGAGTPVVATTVGAIPQFIDHDRDALLVRPGDVDALRHELVRTITDSGLRQRLCDQGRQRFDEAFSLEAFRNHLLAIYAQHFNLPALAGEYVRGRRSVSPVGPAPIFRPE